MDHIYRALIALVLMVASLVAHADTYPAVTQYSRDFAAWFATPSEACAGDPQGRTTAVNVGGACGWQYACRNTSNGNELCLQGQRACPAGGTLDGAQCINAPACTAGQTRNATTGVCEAPPCQAGTLAGSGYVNMGANPAVAGNRKACSGGCEVIFMGSYPELRALVQGKWNYFGKGSYERTGTSCTAADVAVSSSAPTNQCASGQVLGEFNGQPLCLNGGTGEPTNPNTPTPSQTATTNTTSSTNPDGSTTKTETTTKPDGSQVVVMTTTNPDGSSTQTREEKPAPDADPKDDFCKKNPAATLCKTSEFSGGCSAYLCKGDAVYCAMALEQHRRNCELFENATPMSDLGKQIANGNDPQAGQNPASANNRSIIDLGTSLDMSKRWSGGCPTDRQITVMGQTMAIPLSSLCPYLEMFGNIIIALAMLGAARTVGVF